MPFKRLAIDRLTFLVWGVAAVLCFANPTVRSAAAATAETHAVHLILFSGQSNMANLDPARVFIPEVEKHFGAEHVVVVKVARKGQPIRRWYKKWEVTSNQNPVEIGDLYERLIEAAKKTLNGRPIQSVTQIWMQGERDAKDRLADDYEEAFVGILDQIKSDLGVKEIHYIIGRLSDSGLGKKDWDKIREIQQKLGEDSTRSAWVNTDDLKTTTARTSSITHWRDMTFSQSGMRRKSKSWLANEK